MPNIFDHVIDYVKSSVSAASAAEQAPSAALHSWLQNSGYIPVGNVIKVGGETYGPAVTRISRTPLSFSTTEFKDLPGTQGQYLGQGPGLPPEIIIDPAASRSAYGSVGPVIRHESIHAAMDHLPDEMQRDIAVSQPGYRKIANKLEKRWDGYMPVEVPAQMGQGGASGIGANRDVPIDKQKSYMSSFMDSLQAVDPEVAGMVGRIIGGVQTPRK